MKNLIYLFAAVIMLAFTACGGGETTTEETTTLETEEVVTDAAVEEVAEAVGCQVEGGTCLEDHSCCASVNNEDIEYSEDHNHDHGEGEGHDHDH